MEVVMIKLKDILEKMGVGDEYYGTAYVKNGNKVQLYRNTEDKQELVENWGQEKVDDI